LFTVQFTKQKNFNFGACFFLVSIKSGRKNFGIVKNKNVFIAKIINNIFKDAVFDLSGCTI